MAKVSTKWDAVKDLPGAITGWILLGGALTIALCKTALDIPVMLKDYYLKKEDSDAAEENEIVT